MGICWEKDVAYMGNNIVQGIDNKQPSAEACQHSCANNPKCTHWTRLPPEKHTDQGSFKYRCYLKNKRENFTPSDTEYTYVSGSKYCPGPGPGALGTYHLKDIILFESFS